MESEKVYNPRVLLLIFLLFGGMIWLLYSLGKFIHKTNRIHNEISLIETQNERMKTEIEESKRYLAYLRTAERIEKEAKVQLNKMRAGESVIILVEEEKGIIEEEEVMLDIPFVPEEQRSNAEKWRRLFFGESASIW